jgi:hypothetical protein
MGVRIVILRGHGWRIEGSRVIGKWELELGEIYIPPAVGYADRNSARETARQRLQTPAATRIVSGSD